jgi:hypothetical protein
MMASKPMGRPTIYSPELAKKICDLVATNTLGYRKLEELYPDLPDESSVRLWRHTYQDFSLQYAQAKATQAELLAEEIIEIADNGRNDWMESSDDEGGAGWKINGEHINRSRLRIDTRKWHASKLQPKKYGDAKQVEDLTADRDRLKQELQELREQLDAKNKKDY